MSYVRMLMWLTKSSVVTSCSWMMTGTPSAIACSMAGFTASSDVVATIRQFTPRTSRS